MSKTTTSSLDRSVLKLVDGYEAGVERKHARQSSGTDKSELKGKVTAEIAKLHPKRLHLKLSEVIEETPSTKTFRFVSLGAPPSTIPGRAVHQSVRQYRWRGNSTPLCHFLLPDTARLL